MSTTYQTNSRAAGKAVALALCAWLVLMAVGCSDAAKPPAPKTDDKAKASSANTNSVAAYDVEAVFDDDPKKTKDPFFPKSNRRLGKIASGKKGATEAPRMAELHLRGVIGSPGRFIAMINDKTFAAGEKSQVALAPGQYVVVKVNKITDRTVTVTVDGEAAARELSLEPTQEAKK